MRLGIHYYSTREVAEMAQELGRPISQEYVRRLCVTGKIKAIKPGRDWLIPIEQVTSFLYEWTHQLKTIKSCF